MPSNYGKMSGVSGCVQHQLTPDHRPTIGGRAAMAITHFTCQCGCGLPVSIAARNEYRRGWIKGQPIPLRQGHRLRKESSYTNRRTGIGSEVQTVHRTRAEHAIGRSLPLGAVVHHADGSRNENAPLVICQDAAYHNFLHARMRVKTAGGDPNTQRICFQCHRCLPFSSFGASHQSYRTLQLQRKCRQCDNESHRQRKRRACSLTVQRTGS